MNFIAWGDYVQEHMKACAAARVFVNDWTKHRNHVGCPEMSLRKEYGVTDAIIHSILIESGIQGVREYTSSTPEQWFPKFQKAAYIQ